MIDFLNKKEIMLVANAISDIVPECCGVTLGGSRAYELNDNLSDVEMYFYSKKLIPTIEDIEICLSELGAKHKRCESFLWNEYPWGSHSFFVIDGLYFEIGYRVVNDVDNKINAYLNGNVAPTTDCHDLGLGYMYSGLTASVCSEKILLFYGKEIKNLKKKATQFPNKLKYALKIEYLDTAKSLLEGKMLNAVERNDILFYDLLASRVIRAMMVMAFASSKTHFPGDKWNEILLMRTDWARKQDFMNLIKKHCALDSVSTRNLEKKRMILLEAYRIVEESFV